MSDGISNRDATRARIVEVAARLLHEHGPAAVTTRGVALAAGVQPPMIYRLFGDKDGLLEAVAEQVMTTFVTAKAAVVQAASDDGIDALVDLRTGWRAQIEFGLANPTLFRLLSDPDRVRHSPAAELGLRVLESRVRRVAETGRLRVSEARAVGVIQAAGIGVIQTLLAVLPERRDAGLADEMYEAVLRQILDDAPPPADSRVKATAVAFRASVPGIDSLTEAERTFLGEWLDRMIATL